MTRLLRRRAAPSGTDGSWPDHVPPLLRRLYAARGAPTPDDARPKLAGLPDPGLMGSMAAATDLLATAIATDRHVLVVGDFDCDGATACAVAVRGLRMLGARRVSHAVPDRAVHGYGLSPALVAELAPIAPDLLVTVDHGIACHAGIAAAKQLGWQVLVTDHHLPGEALPAADVIVNPNVPGDGFPTRMLAGVGVVFYVLLALRQHLRDAGAKAAADADLSTLLDLVAVGTVADLVPLDGCNRALVGAGLRRIRAGRACAGVQALLAVAGRDASQCSAADIGFGIAPRLNAAGRLEDMGLGIACLLAEDAAQAHAMAARLDAINRERRVVQADMLVQAEAALADALGSANAPDAPAFAHVAHDPGWHPGVVGLVASRLKDRLHRPVVAFAPAAPGSDDLRGSARSIPGFHVRDALAAVDAREPGLIDRFGGHAMAAGLSLPRAHLDRFAAAFLGHARSVLLDASLQAVIESDGALAPHEFDRRHADALRDGGPWGQGFPEPLFDGEFELVDWRVVGERHLRLRVRCDGVPQPLDAIQFGGWQDVPPPRRMRLAYRLEGDDYRGGDAIRLLVEHLEPA